MLVRVFEVVSASCDHPFAHFVLVCVALLQVTPEEARDSWENQFTFSFKKCSHANW